MKRKYLVLASLATGIWLWGDFSLAQNQRTLVDEQGYADMIVVNGKIVSMDDRTYTPDSPGHIYTSMAIKGKKIMALGTNEEMRRLADSKTRIVDVGNRTVIPGLIQTHYHLYSPAARTYGPRFGLTDPSIKLTVTAEGTAEGTAKKIRDTIVNAIQVQALKEGQWITVEVEEGQAVALPTVRTWLFTGQINRRQIDSGTEKHPTLVKIGGLQGMFNTAAVDAFTQLFPNWEHSTDLENRVGAGRDGYVAVPELGGMTFE